MREKNYIVELIGNFIGDKGNRDAFSIFDGKQIRNVTFVQFADDILHAAGTLKENRIIHKHIALIFHNAYEWMVSFFAIAASGNVAVPLNPDLPEEMLRYQIEKADVTVLCGEEAVMAQLKLDTENQRIWSWERDEKAAPISLEEVYRADQGETAVLMFTSGTTGKSKAAELTYENMFCSISGCEEVFFLPDVDRIMAVLPWYHIAGLRGTLAMLYRYKTLCIGRGSRYLLEDMPVLEPSYVFLVPMIVESIVKILKRACTVRERQKYLGSRLKRICIGGAGSTPAACRYLMEQGFVIDGGYAMTETTGVGTWGEWDETHFNTIGKLSEQLQYCIRDGELLLRGPAVMKGYYRDPEATAEVMEDGWLHTGDLVVCDGEGYFYLTGRKKNVIILANGQNISPEEIEEIFCGCYAIKECLVYHDGKMICADVCTDNQKAAAEYIKTYNEKMPLYHRVQKVYYSDVPLEKTGSGKIKRRGANHG